MKALTILQPWASFIAGGHKQIETRSWRTDYRGVIAIHAGKKPERDNLFSPEAQARQAVCAYRGFEAGAAKFQAGAVVAVAALAACARTEDLRNKLGPLEIALGDFSDGRFGWVFSRVAMLREPVLCRGAQSLWTLPDDVATEVVRQATQAGFYHDESGCI